MNTRYIREYNEVRILLLHDIADIQEMHALTGIPKRRLSSLKCKVIKDNPTLRPMDMKEIATTIGCTEKEAKEALVSGLLKMRRYLEANNLSFYDIVPGD